MLSQFDCDLNRINNTKKYEINKGHKKTIDLVKLHPSAISLYSDLRQSLVKYDF
jgi:hypothetical protein